jgi:hypothetical protein
MELKDFPEQTKEDVELKYFRILILSLDLIITFKNN